MQRLGGSCLLTSRSKSSPAVWAHPLCSEFCCLVRRSVKSSTDRRVLVPENGESIPFQVDAFRKHCLLNGLDDIGLTMEKDHLISAFEKQRSETTPWLDGIGYGQQLVA